MEQYDGAIGIVYRKKAEVEFLIIHNKKTGNNTFPAGGRDEGENSSLETASREIGEETGYEKSDYFIKPTGIIHNFVYGPNKKERAGQTAIQPVYLAEVKTTKSPTPLDSDAIIDGWYNYSVAREKLTFDDSKEILDKIKELIK